MSIETYTTIIISIYTGSFLLAVLIGAVTIINRIRKRSPKYWRGIIPCSILYLLSAMFSTFAASIAYDDPADPNYARYKGWEFHDFILHDIRTLIIWLFIGISFYLISKKISKEAPAENPGAARSVKIGCAIVCTVLFAFFFTLSLVRV